MREWICRPPSMMSRLMSPESGGLTKRGEQGGSGAEEGEGWGERVACLNPANEDYSLWDYGKCVGSSSLRGFRRSRQSESVR